MSLLEQRSYFFICESGNATTDAGLRCNFPNGDMVGHTGNYDATIMGVESFDLALARIIKVCDEYNV